MARPMWKGSVNFGLVNVPVRMYRAVSERDVRFHLLHAKDKSRVREKRFCEAEGVEIPYEEIIKGYEISKGTYVTITPEEIKALAPKGTYAIDVEDFVPTDDIHPLYFNAHYHLVPETNAARAYALLSEALATSGRVGVGRVVLRTRQHACAVRPNDSGLLLSTLHSVDEVIPLEQIDGMPSHMPRVNARELATAEQLIDSLSAPFDPDKYRDVYREQLEEVLRQKAGGMEIRPSPTAPPEYSAPENLMDALKRSLAAAKKDRDEEAPSRGGAHRTAHRATGSRRVRTPVAARTAKRKTRKKS
ncbi:Ku protein [Hyalangium rubrum]|uniref:Non-homologous end joining protein Ku n=1 Tax=Hyalangium rubrum TaxID=3103134 RepID=A0ABU5H3J4_9BACT|nr:Ku protein [Hyalangium sp. s54d21]MDY7227474.1 Ku protein [Hyalangium sp. s54d21]